MSGWKIVPNNGKQFQTTKISSNSILADNSLAEFEELENQLAGSQGSLKEIDYDAILAEIDQDLDDGIGRMGFKYLQVLQVDFNIQFGHLSYHME